MLLLTKRLNGYVMRYGFWKICELHQFRAFGANAQAALSTYGAHFGDTGFGGNRARSGISEERTYSECQGTPLERDISMGLGFRGILPADIEVQHLEDQVRLLKVADLSHLNDFLDVPRQLTTFGDALNKTSSCWRSTRNS